MKVTTTIGSIQRRSQAERRALKLLASTAMATAALFGSLVAHNVASAARPPVVTPGISQTAMPAVRSAGLIDHSSVSASDLLPEPNAELLHSEPNAYVNANTLRGGSATGRRR